MPREERAMARHALLLLVVSLPTRTGMNPPGLRTFSLRYRPISMLTG